MLQAHQLATSLFFTRSVAGYETVTVLHLGFDADVVECGNRLAKIRAASTSPGCRRNVPSCSRAENLLLRGIPGCTQYQAVSRKNLQYRE